MRHYNAASTARTTRMEDRLTDNEWERIEEFANTPMHERTPELLTPGNRD